MGYTPPVEKEPEIPIHKKKKKKKTGEGLKGRPTKRGVAIAEKEAEEAERGKGKTDKERFAEIFEKEKAKGLAVAKPQEKEEEGKGILDVLKDPVKAFTEWREKAIGKSNLKALGYATLGAGIAVAGVAGAAGLGALKAGLGGKAAVSGLITKSPAVKVIGSGSKFATNTKTMALTKGFIGKVLARVKSPQAIAGVVTAGIVGAIGSYPFAGFIKEESLQTLSFGVKSATYNKDIEGAESALAEQEEILNPKVWDQVLGAVPFVNVLEKLKDFYNAAQKKLEIDRKVVADMKIQRETGETDSQMWGRLDNEKATREKAIIDYFNEQRIITEKEIQRIKRGRRKPVSKERQEELQKERTADFLLWSSQQKSLVQRQRVVMKGEKAYWGDYLEAVWDARAPIAGNVLFGRDWEFLQLRKEEEEKKKKRK